MSRKRKQSSPSVTSDEEDDRSVKYNRRPATDQPVLRLDNTSLDTGHLPLLPVEDRMLSDSLPPLDVFSDSGTGSDLLLEQMTTTDPEINYELETGQFVDSSDLGLDYQRLPGVLLSTDSPDQGVDMVDLSLPDMGGTLNNTAASTPRRPNKSAKPNRLVSSTSVTSASGKYLSPVSSSTAESPEKSISGCKHSECTKRASGAIAKPLPREPYGPTSRDSSEPPSAVPSRSVSATSSTSQSGSDTSERLRRVKCRICNKCFKNMHMDYHMRTAHDVETLTLIICQICKRPYDNQDTLRQHMMQEHPDTVNEPKGVKCDICNKVLSSIYTLEKHKQKIHSIEESGFSCLYCDKIFKTSNRLYTHIQKEHPIARPNTSIPVRAKAQSTPSRLPKPLSETPAMVPQLRPVSPSSRVSATSVAPVSRMSVSSASGTSLISVSPSTAAPSKKSISGRNHSECSMQASGTTFKPLRGEPSGPTSRNSSEPPSAVPSRSVSATNVTSSSGSDYSARLGRYKCSFCNEMPFYSNHYLELHLKTAHNQESTTLKTCEICGRHYSTQNKLRYHMKQEHPAETLPEPESWECEICNKVFCKKSTLENHKQKIHSIPKSGIPCPHCGKIYVEFTGLNIHIAKKHPGQPLVGQS